MGIPRATPALRRKRNTRAARHTGGAGRGINRRHSSRASSLLWFWRNLRFKLLGEPFESPRYTPEHTGGLLARGRRNLRLGDLAQPFDLTVKFSANLFKDVFEFGHCPSFPTPCVRSCFTGAPAPSDCRSFSVPRVFRYYRYAFIALQGDHVQLPVRWRYKLDRWRNELRVKFRSEPKVARPRLCPACGTLAGATATKCYQCGANLNFSLAAATRSVSGFMPQTSPVSYAILGLCCLLYGVSLLSTIHQTGFAAPTGGLGALFGLGAISNNILARMGASAPLPYDLIQPWRFVTAIFLHASLLHIGFNMWVLMDLAPTIEEMYGSARFLFVFVLTGACGYLASAASGHSSVGASGALLGMIGLLLALTG